MDQLADEPHNLPLTPYHYVNNNPMLFIDPDGMDWWVGNNGEMMYHAGVTELPTEYNKNYWTHFGGDDLFPEVTEGYNFILKTSEYAESFMCEQGYKKVATQAFIADYTDIISKPQPRYTLQVETGETTIINEKYSYSEKGNNQTHTKLIKDLNPDSRTILDWDGSTSNYELSRVSISYSRKNLIWMILDPVIKAFNPSTKQKVIYESWEEYPENGIYREYQVK